VGALSRGVSEVARERDPFVVQAGATQVRVPPVGQAGVWIAQEFIDQARAHGVSLVGPGGLLSQTSIGLTASSPSG